jgi:hypothetical protein
MCASGYALEELLKGKVFRQNALVLRWKSEVAALFFLSYLRNVQHIAGTVTIGAMSPVFMTRLYLSLYPSAATSKRFCLYN